MLSIALTGGLMAKSKEDNVKPAEPQKQGFSFIGLTEVKKKEIKKRKKKKKGLMEGVFTVQLF